MTQHERLLALDVALCSVEGWLPSAEMRQAAALLQNELDKLLTEPAEFGAFLAAQKEAVQKLAESPEFYGY